MMESLLTITHNIQKKLSVYPFTTAGGYDDGNLDFDKVN